MQRGDVVRLGKHRLMCGDAGNPADVARLFDGVLPDLVFTSPPYLQQRTYGGNNVGCWDTLMQRVFGAVPAHAKTQILVNLGLVHRDGEWLPYWHSWIEWMRTQGWRRFGCYVWDKLNGMPGNCNGRFFNSFEFIFHFNKRNRVPNRTVPLKLASIGRKQNGRAMRNCKVGTQTWRPEQTGTNTHKVSDSVLRLSPEKANRYEHAAVFPITLPLAIQAAYTDEGDKIYEPFGGSGTSIVAAEQGGRICYAMEIEPSYCDIAVKRWEQRK